MRKTLGIVGARGHTGAELIRLIARHPSLELAFVSSRELDGERVSDHVDEFSGDLRYENLGVPKQSQCAAPTRSSSRCRTASRPTMCATIGANTSGDDVSSICRRIIASTMRGTTGCPS